MNMKFDLDREPATAQMLTEEKKRICLEIDKLKGRSRWSWFAHCLMGAVTIAAVMLMQPGVLMWVAAPAAILACSAHLASMSIDRSIKDTTTYLSRLKPIEPKDCPQIVGLCERYDFVAAYQRKVSELGRALVDGEVSAIHLWKLRQDDKEERGEIEAHQRAAFLRLMAPVKPLAP